MKLFWLGIVLAVASFLLMWVGQEANNLPAYVASLVCAFGALICFCLDAEGDHRR